MTITLNSLSGRLLIPSSLSPFSEVLSYSLFSLYFMCYVGWSRFLTLETWPYGGGGLGAQQHSLLSSTLCSMSAPFSSGGDRHCRCTSSRTGRWAWPPACLPMRPTLGTTGCGPHRGQGRLPMWFAVWPADRCSCAPERLVTRPGGHTAAAGPLVGGTGSSLRA